MVLQVRVNVKPQKKVIHSTTAQNQKSYICITNKKTKIVFSQPSEI